MRGPIKILLLAAVVLPAAVVGAAAVSAVPALGSADAGQRKDNPLGKLASKLKLKLKRRLDGAKSKLLARRKRKRAILEPEPERVQEAESPKWEGTESSAFNDFMSLVIPISLLAMLASTMYGAKYGDEVRIEHKLKSEERQIDAFLEAMEAKASSNGGGGWKRGGNVPMSETEKKKGLATVWEEWNNRRSNSKADNVDAEANADPAPDLPAATTMVEEASKMEEEPLNVTVATENETDDDDSDSSSVDDDDNDSSSSGEASNTVHREDAKKKERQEEEEEAAAARLLAILQDEAAVMAREEEEASTEKEERKMAEDRAAKAKAKTEARIRRMYERARPGVAEVDKAMVAAEEEAENEREVSVSASPLMKQRAEERAAAAKAKTEARIRRMYERARPDVAEDARVAEAVTTETKSSIRAETSPPPKAEEGDDSENDDPENDDPPSAHGENPDKDDGTDNLPFDEQHPPTEEDGGVVQISTSAEDALAIDRLETADFLAAEDEAEALALAEEDEALRYQLAQHESDVALHEALAEEARMAEEQWRGEEGLDLVDEEEKEHYIDDGGDITEEEDEVGFLIALEAEAALRDPEEAAATIADMSESSAAAAGRMGRSESGRELAQQSSLCWGGEGLDVSFDGADVDGGHGYGEEKKAEEKHCVNGEGRVVPAVRHHEGEYEYETESELTESVYDSSVYTDSEDDIDDLALIEALEAEAAARALEAVKAIDKAENAVGQISPMGKGNELRMSLRRSSSMLQTAAEC